MKQKEGCKILTHKAIPPPMWKVLDRLLYKIARALDVKVKDLFPF